VNGLILASGSATRAALLQSAGLTFAQVRPAYDEEAGKQRLREAGIDIPGQVLALAEAKAMAVSKAHPDALVIGSDQMLACEGCAFDKPRDLEEAASHLQRLSGRAHQLLTGAVLLQNGKRLWSHLEAPVLRMRPLSAAFVAEYLKAIGERALQSPGAYQVEGLGVQLFAAIEGDWFAILGLPLLPLLEELRQRGIVQS